MSGIDDGGHAGRQAGTHTVGPHIGFGINIGGHGGPGGRGGPIGGHWANID